MPVLLIFLIAGAGLGAIQGAAAAPAVPQAGAWTQQDPLPTRYTFDQVDMISASEGWAVAYQDILHTTDAGVTWVRQPSPIADHLYSVRFLDAQHGWIGSNNTVLYTTNGGASWGQGNGVIGSIYNVEFATLTTGFATYGDAGLYQTTDGGHTWTNRTMPNPIGRVQFFDANSGVANSPAGVYHTANRGATWTLTAGPHGGTTFVTPTLGWFVSQDQAARTTDGGATWQAQTVPAGTWTYDAKFVDATHGWAVGNSLIRTTDGGATWLPAPLLEPNEPPFWTVDFTDATHGIVAGNAGQVVASTDGGATWLRRHHGMPGEAGDFVALDRNQVWAALGSGRVLYTTDGGQDWRTSLVGDASVTLRSIDMADTLNGWTVGGGQNGGRTYHTTDGGRTWQQQNATSQYLYGVDALDAQTAIVVGGGTQFTAARRTTDGGATWQDMAVGLPDILYLDVFFLTPTTGWIVGSEGGIAKSTDGGLTWVRQPAPASYGLTRIHFSDANNGWAGGYFQVLLHTTNGGATWTAQNPNIPDRTHVLGVSAVSAQVAWIAGYGAGAQSRPYVKYTTDGGATWIEDTPAVGPYDGFGPVLFLDAGYGWAGGAAGIFRHIDPSIPTPTPSPTPASVLVAQATWQGRPAPPHTANQLPITLTLRLGTTTQTFANVQTDANGVFTVPVGTLPNGVYTWWAKGPQYLATSGTITLSGAPTTSLALGPQRAGDVNNDNLIDVADFSAVRTAFGAACGDIAYDSRAELTGDCLVDVADFSLVRSNFGQAGPPTP